MKTPFDKYFERSFHMSKRIIDLISESKYEDLKTVLEAKVASKVIDKIQEKKNNFISRMKAKKEESDSSILNKGE